MLASVVALVMCGSAVEQRASRIRRQSPNINVHQIPKTSFSCADKSAGEYYADPEAQCQVYHICVAGAFGRLTKMSFACPNGTIFSQSSRVCSPYDRVYCALAERFYENVMGTIDTDKDYYTSLRVDAPVFNAITPNHERPEKRRRPVRPVEPDYDDFDITTTPEPPPTPRRRTQQNSNSRRRKVGLLQFFTSVVGSWGSVRSSASFFKIVSRIRCSVPETTCRKSHQFVEGRS